MARADRLWLYAGLAGLAGIGLVRLLGAPRVRRGDRVLIVGDSLAVGLTPPLTALAKDGGVQLQSLAKEGTRIDQWSQSAALKEALDKFQPTLVLISLGTNDEYMQGKDVGARQRPELQRLIELIDHFPRKVDYGLGPEQGIVWIGPPTLPKAQTNGVVPMILAEASALRARFRYFPSQRLTIPRGADQIHPTARGYAAWAGALWQWLS